jgi:tetratricopeptide (TPR) repeat protein
MKQFLCLIVLSALVHAPACHAQKPQSSDRFVEIYFLIQAGDAARADNNAATAAAKYTEALNLLRQIKAEKPDWHPQIVDYRLKYCTQQLQALGAPTPAPVAPAPQPPAPVKPATPVLPAAPAAEAKKLAQLNQELVQAQAQIRDLQRARAELEEQFNRYKEQTAPADPDAAKKLQEQLTDLRTINAGLTAKLEEAQAASTKAAITATELQHAQENVRTLEASREDLQKQLQAALAKAAAAQTNPQVEELLSKNADLTTQLAAAQNKITELSTRADTAASTVAAQIQLRADFERLQLENASLRQSRDEALEKLAESDRQLRGARAAALKNDQLIVELQRENKLMRELIQGDTSRDRQRGTVSANDTASNELRNWRPRKRPAPSSTAVSESAKEKLVATLSAPVPAPSEPEPKPEPVPAPPPPAPKPAPVEPPSASPVADAAKVIAPKPAEPVASTETAALLDEARADLTNKDFDSAAKKYEKVLEREPDNMRALANLAVIRYRQGKLEEAETILRKTIATQPNDSAARSMMGVIYFRRGKIEEAYNELTRAVALDPRNFEAHNYLGIVMSEKGWPAAAEQEVRRAIELNPRYADAHFNLAVMYARQKTPRFELSRYHYQQAIDLGSLRDEKLEALLKDAGVMK